MLGLRPWLAFFRRTLAFFFEVRFDIAGQATGGGWVDSRRPRARLPLQPAVAPAAGLT